MSIVTMPLVAPFTSHRPRHLVHADPPAHVLIVCATADRIATVARSERPAHLHPHVGVADLDERVS